MTDQLEPSKALPEGWKFFKALRINIETEARKSAEKKPPKGPGFTRESQYIADISNIILSFGGNFFVKTTKWQVAGRASRNKKGLKSGRLTKRPDQRTNQTARPSEGEPDSGKWD